MHRMGQYSGSDKQKMLPVRLDVTMLAGVIKAKQTLKPKLAISNIQEDRRSHRKNVPVWPVVSIPAKNSAAISGNIWLSDRGFPDLGSFALSSRSAKLPRCGFTALMCPSRFQTMVCMQRADLSASHEVDLSIQVCRW